MLDHVASLQEVFIGSRPAERKRRIEHIALTGGVGVASKVGNAEGGIVTIVETIGRMGGVIDITVLPVIERGAAAVEIRDVCAKPCVQLVAVEIRIPPEYDVALHPAFLA